MLPVTRRISYDGREAPQNFRNGYINHRQVDWGGQGDSEDRPWRRLNINVPLLSITFVTDRYRIGAVSSGRRPVKDILQIPCGRASGLVIHHRNIRRQSH